MNLKSANPNSIDSIVPSWDCSFGSHCVDLLCNCTDSYVVPCKIAVSICIPVMEMNKICSGDAFAILCECHGSADVCDSEECCSCVIGQNYDVCDSR